MDNQHKKIKGYRDLSQEEIDLMNEINEHGEKTGQLIEKLFRLRDSQFADYRKECAEKTPDPKATYEDVAECDIVGQCGLSGLQLSESNRCMSVAREHLQTGQMWLVRAAALPDSF